MTIPEAAQRLDVNRKTVLRWIVAERLPARKLPGKTGAYLIDARDVDRLVKSRALPTSPRGAA